MGRYGALPRSGGRGLSGKTVLSHAQIVIVLCSPEVPDRGFFVHRHPRDSGGGGGFIGTGIGPPFDDLAPFLGESSGAENPG